MCIPAKTEVRFRRAAAVADAVREAVRGALASAGYVRAELKEQPTVAQLDDQSAAQTSQSGSRDFVNAMSATASESPGSSPSSLSSGL